MAGVVLLIALIVVVGLLTGQFIKLDSPWWTFFWRWLHTMAGIMWVGLLWYLNFVQTPTVPKIEPAEHSAAITRFIAPNVLFWFRYAALATVVLGLILAWQKGYIAPFADKPDRIWSYLCHISHCGQAGTGPKFFSNHSSGPAVNTAGRAGA